MTQPDPAKLLELKTLLAHYVPDEGPLETNLAGVYVYKTSHPHTRQPERYDAGVVIMASGKKRCYINNKLYNYNAGSYLAVFLPMPVEVEVIEASPEDPLLLVGLKLDLRRLAELLLQLDRLESPSTHAQDNTSSTSGIFSAPLPDALLDATIRLLKTLDSPADQAVLGQNIITEIYYRLLVDNNTRELSHLLAQRGQIQQIARAVDHINQHLDEPVVIASLAAEANMSMSHFHKCFKDVMHMSPLQYAKSMKLFKAQSLIQAGTQVSQAGYAVGYNSAAQFSREYKRQFGVTPSLQSLGS
ncbi:MAG: AraC family transcriptional regulator [Deinococcota bacterium]